MGLVYHTVEKMVKVRERHSNRPTPVTFELSDGRCSTCKKLFTSRSHTSLRPSHSHIPIYELYGKVETIFWSDWVAIYDMTPPCQREICTFPKRHVELLHLCPTCPRSEGVCMRGRRAAVPAVRGWAGGRGEASVPARGLPRVRVGGLP